MSDKSTLLLPGLDEAVRLIANEIAICDGMLDKRVDDLTCARLLNQRHALERVTGILQVRKAQIGAELCACGRGPYLPGRAGCLQCEQEVKGGSY